MTTLSPLALLLLATLPAVAQDTPAAEPADAEAGDTAARPTVELQTTEGKIVVELFADEAPKSVESFLAYAESGFYDGTIFHRVIPNFMIQGGGFTAQLEKKPVRPPVENEADNRLPNDRGTLALARTSDPHSATSQFYINVVDNDSLNHRNKTPRGWGYCVFGRVVEGMDVVDAIAGVATGFQGGMRDVPKQPVVIEKVTVR